MLIFDSLSKASLSDVLLWRDIKASGVCFSSALLSWYFLFSGSMNFLTPFTRLANIFLLLGALHRFGYLEKFSERNLLFLEERISSATRIALIKIYPTLIWETPGNSLLAVALCFILSIISGFLSFSASILFVIFCAFSLPISYQKNRQIIDGYAAQLNNQVIALVGSRLRKSSHVDPANKSFLAEEIKEKKDRVNKAFFEAKNELLNKGKVDDYEDAIIEDRKQK